MADHIKRLATLDLAIIALVIIAQLSLDGRLPPELQDFLRNQLEADITILEALSSLGFLVVAVMHLIALLGLIFQKDWAPKLFIITAIAAMPFCFLMGPVVLHPTTYTFDSISLLITGIIMGMLLSNKSEKAA